MRKSTKILIFLTILSFVPNIFLTKYLLAGIIPTEDGFQFEFTALSWVALAFQVVFNVLFGILFFRFLKTQRLSNAVFFSVLPLTIAYGGFMVYVTAVKALTGVTAESIRATLNIETSETSYNNFLWAGIATIVYLVLMFVILLYACKPLSKVEKITQNLGDGRIKGEEYKVGGGKQFKQIEHSLNKISYNFKSKDNKIKKVNLESQKLIPKQFFKFLGKSCLSELELGNQVKKSATILFCDLKSIEAKSHSLTLEENFNYINSYLKIVAPIVKRYDGFIDKYMGDSVLAVFAKSQNAIECAHCIVKAIEVKNKGQKDMPKIDARFAINSGDVIFGIVGDEDKKIPTIVSDTANITTKIEEINFYIGTKILLTKYSLNNLPDNFVLEYRYTGDLSMENGDVLALYESLNYYPKSKRDKLVKSKNKFEQGVKFYNEGDYKNAKEIFANLLKIVPDDKVSFVYFNKATEKMKEIA